ncbi:ORF7 [Felid gammaherpesvirus 1]|uniref:ORF7 n=1 Tax=Felid gammaherpesvirus 1 TaxID=2560468 RepID=A0A0M4MS34_9GAMA|nr:ORF7 [Felis catus gammaherpesvirus 1]ALE14720.1 ORF7 [Felis catus gammaherpesvirus 1]
MARELAAVYSQIFHLAMDVSLLTYCDPRLINKNIFEQTITQMSRLISVLDPSLQAQNEMETSGLSLELQHIMLNTLTEMKSLYMYLTSFKDNPKKYFEELHLTQKCQRHLEVDVVFYGNCVKTCQLSLLNDIEIMFKRINSLFYCIPTDSGCKCISETIGFLGNLRGISPIPHPATYLTSVPCIKCYDEASMYPNQGECILTMLSSDVDCPHICQPVNADPIIGLFETELKKLSLVPNHIKKSSTIPVSEKDKLTQMSVNTLKDHTIFEKVTTSILELSNLIYWNSNALQNTQEAAASDLSALANILTYEANMHEGRKTLAEHLKYTENTNHFFDLFQPNHLESLFCGGIFYSLDDAIKALKKDCSQAFFKKSNYQALIKRQNELFVRLSKLLQNHDNSEGENSDHTKKHHLTSQPPETSTQRVLSDAQVRKEAYIQKITKDGLKNLNRCLETQGIILTNTLNLRIWGSTIYEIASVMKNHFLSRRHFMSIPWQNNTDGNDSSFENSKYMKNSLHLQKLSHEHIESLRAQFYEILTGPLSKSNSLFPIPSNVSLAYCIDASGMIPHQKLMLTEIIWPTIEPKDWIDFNFNQFYTFKSSDLNSIQKEALLFIREIVLSTSLYNQTWEKDLAVFPLTHLNTNYVERQPHDFKDGVYLTFEEGCPLVLVYSKQGFIFKDLYALLYCHLQLSST